MEIVPEKKYSLSVFSPSSSQSYIKLPQANKYANTTFISQTKASYKILSKENEKLKQLVNTLRDNLKTSEEHLKRTLQDSTIIEQISILKFKNKTLEKKLSESESNYHNANMKFQKLQKDTKELQKERNEFQAMKEEKEVAAEKFRIMKNKALDLLVHLFSEETPKNISLRYMEIDNSFIPVIGCVLKRYPTVENLDLEGNFINDSGAKLLADVLLSTDSNIKEINLNYNKITVEGAWLIIQALKIREDTKFKKISKVTLVHNLIDKITDIYIKMLEYFKQSQSSLPQKIKSSDLRRVSNTTAAKLFASSIGNVKGIQDIIVILDRVTVSETQNSSEITLHNPTSLGGITEEYPENEAEIPNPKKKTSLKNKNKLDISSFYNTKGDFLSSIADNWAKSACDVNDIDEGYGETLLMHAARIGNIRLTKLLINRKANIEMKNDKGENAFLLACKNDNYDIANYIQVYGGNINTCNHKGAKAIHIAVKDKKPYTICRLVEMGLKINSVDFHSKTPLHYAARLGDVDTGKLLIELGADLNMLDFKGRTPAGLAEDKEHFNFADTLEKLGGKKIKGYEELKNEYSEFRSLSSLNRESQALSMDLKIADKLHKKIYRNHDN